MTNLNSREVARQIILSNVGRTFSEGDDPIGEAASILDSALLAANPGAEELARDLDRVAQFLCIDGENCPACKGIFSRVVNILSAALESAKREERARCEKKRIDDLMHWRDTAGTDEEVEILECLINIPKYKIDSLAEKEGGK